MLKKQTHFFLISVVSLVSFSNPNFGTQSKQTEPQTSKEAFNTNINTKPLATGVAVWKDGRLRSLESHAREWLGFVTGGQLIDNTSPLFTMLDVAFRPDYYRNQNIVYVKNKQVRLAIVTGMELDFGLGSDGSSGYFMDFVNSGFISPEKINGRFVRKELAKLRTDVLRFDKPVSQIEQSLAAINPDRIRFSLSLIPPPTGSLNDRWIALDELRFEKNIDDENIKRVSLLWSTLQRNWIKKDFKKCNENIKELSALLQVNGSKYLAYPKESKLFLESMYFRSNNFSQIWIGYLFTIVVLLVGLVYRWKRVVFLGFLLFCLVFMLHSITLGWRWYISGRWPNTNMFEAITTAAWFGGLFALLIEPFIRKTLMFGIFALTSSASSMFALMSTALFPTQLNSSISNRMPVLHDVWLYIHTNVIIFSYCLIFFASVSSFLYLFWRFKEGFGGGNWIGGTKSYAIAGGTQTLTQMKKSGVEYRATLGQVLDATTMILVELSFILLWSGIIMGAIWADHSWGRPWGWDPKEVFALNTFLIFALLIHIRMKAVDKGLWTAVLAIIGCGVMIFNWVIINFAISGLHSYA